MKFKIERLDPFRPDFSFVTAFLAFILIGYAQGLKLHLETLAIISLGLAAYLGGVILGELMIHMKTLLKSTAADAGTIALLLAPALTSSIIFRSVSVWVAAGLFVGALLMVFLSKYLIRRMSEPRLRFISQIVIVSALVIYAYNIITLGGFPFSNEFTAFDYELKLSASYSVARLVSISLFLLGSAAFVVASNPDRLRDRVAVLFLGVVGLVIYGLLLGFRNQILRVVFVIFLACWYKNLLGRRALAVASFALVPIVYEFSRRFYDTLFFFDQLVLLVSPLGRTLGAVLFTETGHTIVMQTILDLYFRYGSAGREGLSTTWLGPPYLDYGVSGVMWSMLWVGLLMGSTFEMVMNSKGIIKSLMTVSYSFIWPHVMITIETGPALNTMLLLTFFSALTLANIRLTDQNLGLVEVSGRGVESSGHRSHPGRCACRIMSFMRSSNVFRRICRHTYKHGHVTQPIFTYGSRSGPKQTGPF